MTSKLPIIDTSLARRLVDTQFPKWKDLPIAPVAVSGWDNRTFHLGQNLSIRLPSAEPYALQVEKEQTWLPRLAPYLPLPIPVPVAMGEPGEGYPWKWSIYEWLEGESAAKAPISDLTEFASDLARFLLALQRVDSTGGPPPGLHSFYRGGSLAHYDSETRQAIAALAGRVDPKTATEIWEEALTTSWERQPVWVHGDISVGNLLVQEGKLCGVIDFGQLAVGDPACDLGIAWTLFEGESRSVFRDQLGYDLATWGRARGWVLWKALVTAAGFTDPNNVESVKCWRILAAVLK